MSEEKGKEVAVKDMGIRELINGPMKKQFANALPKHLTPDRFVRVALTALTKTPKLMQCTTESLMSCLLDCSQLGLEPDGRKAYLIPYGNVCTLIIGYQGLVDRARRSGEIADIHADIVCQNDHFVYSFGTDSRLEHRPSLSDRGEVIAAYSYVRLKDGSSSYEVMNKQEVDAIRKRSKASGSGPWVTDWAEMAKKTVFRRHSKWLPVSAEVLDTIEKDYDLAADVIDLNAEPRKGKPQIAMPKALSEATPAQEAPEDAPRNPLADELEKLVEKADVKTVESFSKWMGDLGASSIDELNEEQLKAGILALGKKAKK